MSKGGEWISFFMPKWVRVVIWKLSVTDPVKSDQGGWNEMGRSRGWEWLKLIVGWGELAR
jgi:hypothetical protein